MASAPRLLGIVSLSVLAGFAAGYFCRAWLGQGSPEGPQQKETRLEPELDKALAALSQEHLRRSTELYNIFVEEERTPADLSSPEAQQAHRDALKQKERALLQENADYLGKIKALKAR